MSFTQTRGAMPTVPAATDVALEAGVTQDRAAAMIAASWVLVETFTGRNYWPVTGAVLVADLGEDQDFLNWPRQPFPEDVEAAMRVEGVWIPVPAPGGDYVPEAGTLMLLPPENTYRVEQAGTVTPPTPGPHVVEAVRALALYQLVHSPARREFRTMTGGDSTVTREALDGLFRASGAGILLAGEVRW